MRGVIRMPDVIARKRNGLELAADEITAFVQGVVDGSVSGPQIGAFLMAVYFQGMTSPETGTLLSAMVQSGDKLEWPAEWKGLMVDKHSTGGVGDKVSLPLAPALAALGLKVPMISGRGLGYTGGTLDKLESIPGFRVMLSGDEIRTILDDVGCIIAGQTGHIVPADKKLYAIRDVTATVDILPLIVGSILSKKLAENIEALVMEVTFGKVCSMQTESDARRIAKAMIDQGRQHGLKVSAMLTHMDHPLGMTVGNALEIREAVQCLYGKASKDLMEAVCKLGGQLLVDTKKAPNLRMGMSMIDRTLKDGRARAKFRDMLVAQGVAPDTADSLVSRDFSCLPTAKHITSLKAKKTGFVHGIEAYACASVAHQLGGGRTNEGDAINFAVGIELTAKIGDCLNEGEEWAKVHHDSDLTEKQMDDLANAIDIKTGVPDIRDRITDVIT